MWLHLLHITNQIGTSAMINTFNILESWERKSVNKTRSFKAVHTCIFVNSKTCRVFQLFFLSK